MNNPRRWFGTLLALGLILLGSRPVSSEFYRYVNEHGETRYVDRIDKVPARYRDQATVYREKYDHLDAAERARMENRDRERSREQSAAERARDQVIEAFQARQRERRDAEEKEKLRRLSETPVAVEGNRVLVPVRLGHNRKEVEVRLVLDTGASIVVLHRDVARKLRISSDGKSLAKVAGGGTIRVDRVKVDWLKVGPYKMPNLDAIVIDHKGPDMGYDGLLGMNFLQAVDYRVDFGRRVIHWQPDRGGGTR